MDCSFKVYKLHMCMSMYVIHYFMFNKESKHYQCLLGKLKGVFRLIDEKRYYHEHRTGEGFEPSIQLTSAEYRMLTVIRAHPTASHSGHIAYYNSISLYTSFIYLYNYSFSSMIIKYLNYFS